MEVSEYTETFAKFILSCRKQYDELCRSIDDGEVPGGHGVSIRIDIPAEDIDRIRFDRILEGVRHDS
jgi:hypothetical protein